ncbi:hypothetical protein [Pseudomonas sp. 25 R 14]|nr:hypothetical protein [Pseudomonas sp. 25 R 14]
MTRCLLYQFSRFDIYQTNLRHTCFLSKYEKSD